MKTILQKFDKTFVRLIGRLPTNVRPLMQLGTLLGQPVVTVGIGSSVIGYGIAVRSDALVLAGTIAVTTIMVTSLLKLTLRRPRPQNDYVQSMLVKTFSFPSGHAAGSVVSFGLLALVLNFPLWAGGLVAATCTMIGISRVYMGAHYPSDVLGGWILGITGVCVILAAGN